MAERSYSYYGAASASESEEDTRFDSDLDLDWELQRLLGEELSAMEPEESAPDATTIPPMPQRIYTVPASELSARQGQEEPLTSQPRIAPLDSLSSPQYDAMALKLSEDLSAELDGLYQQITREIGVRRELFEEVTEVLRQAREALLRGPQGVSEAEKLTKQAQGLLRRKDESRRWASSYGVLILAYEILFFVAFIAVLAFDAPLAAWAGALTGVAAVSMQSILPFWETMVWGGIGGVLGALYSLYWHIAEKQDFDRQYNIWYVVQPIMGVMLGALIFLIVASGMLAMRSSEPTAATWLPSALACLCGFRQKFIFELLDKLMELIGLRPILNKSASHSKD